MKIFTRKTTIWGVWTMGLIALIICVMLQNLPLKISMIKTVVDSCISCSIPYIFFTTFYVIAIVSKQYRKLMYLFLIDVTTSILVVSNIGYFYEGTMVGRYSAAVLISVTYIKKWVLSIKKPS